MEEYYRRSITTRRKFNIFDENILHIVNPSQAAFYVSKGCDLLAVKPGTNRKTGDPLLVYWFFKDESKNAYDEWCKRKKDSQ